MKEGLLHQKSSKAFPTSKRKISPKKKQIDSKDPEVDPNTKAQQRISKICNLFPNNYELNRCLK